MFLITLSQAWGGEIPSGISETDFYDIPMNTTTATLLRQPLSETPMAVTIIDRQMIEASGFFRIADLLRLVPGFQVGMSALDHVPAVTYHGHADAFPRRMQVLVDGRSVFGAILANIDWEDIGVQLQDIDRIEVIRGPNTPVYGANAFTSVIHIITKPAYADHGFFDQTLAGSQATREHTLRFANQDNNLDYRITLHNSQTDGFDNHNDESKVDGANVRLTQQLSSSQTLDLQLGYSEGPMGRAGATFAFQGDGTKQVSRQFQSLKWSHSLPDGAESVVIFSHHHRREDDLRSVGTLSDITGLSPAQVASLFPGHENEKIYTAGYDYSAQRLDAQWRYISNQNQALKWVSGIDSRLDRLRSKNLVNKAQYINSESVRFSLNGTYKITQSLLGQAGIMREFSQMFAETSSGRVGLNYHFNPKHTLRWSYTRGHRLPALLEEYFDFATRFSDGTRIDTHQFSEGGLQPEHISSIEIGYYGNPITPRLQIDLKLYREKIENEIEEITDTDGTHIEQVLPPDFFDNYVFVRKNSGRTEISGAEFQLRYQASNRAFLTFAYAFAESEIDGDSHATRVAGWREFPPVPRHSYSLLMSHGPIQGYSVSSAIYRQSDMTWWGDGEDAPAYVRVDARLAKQWNSKHLNTKLEFVVQNLGEPYNEFDERNLFETQTYVRLSVQAD